MGHRQHPGLALVASLLLLLLSGGRAAAAEVEAKVTSVRPGKVYLELKTPITVKVGARVVVRSGGETEVRTAVLALSSKFVAIEAPGLEHLEVGATVTLSIDAGAAAPARTAAPTGPAATDPTVKPGRAVPTADDYGKKPPPAVAPVPFRRRPAPAAAEGPPPAPGPEGATAQAEEAPSNVVTGELELGADAVVDDAADIERTTLFGRLAVEVDRIGGSDRTRFRMYGSVRQPFDGEWDLTGKHEDHLIAELSAFVLEVDAKPEEQVHSFTDRIELKLGRAAVPYVVEAGLVDGGQVGIRFGAITVFGYAGAGASPDPERSDYDTVVYGGGARFAKTFAHSGALRMSLAGGQQRFRGEGERDFVEAQLDARYDRLSVRGSLVVDFFDTIKDKPDIRLTTGILRVGWQLTSAIRLEAGYSERRPQYQTAYLREFFPPVLALFDPDEERRTIDALALIRLGALWDLTLRGTVYEGPAARKATGGTLSIGKNDTFARDRISLDLTVHHRFKGSGYDEHSTDPYAALTYAYYGEMVMWQWALFYRATTPRKLGDQRYGTRLSADLELGAGFALRAWGELELRQGPDDEGRGEVFLGGLAARYRF